MSKTIEIGLAPMEGTTDFPTRVWFSVLSRPEVITTPFLRITETFPLRASEITEEWPELKIANLPYRWIPQIMASDVDHVLRFFERLDRVYTGVIELNCGCPSPKVVGHGAGSSLLADIDRFSLVIQSLQQRLGASRFRVKMRTGFHHEGEFEHLLDALKEIPLNRLTVHGRTREQKYSGLANWQLIEQAAETLPYPVCGSGDIVDAASFAERRQWAPSVGAMICGRGALQHPWIFRSLRAQASSMNTRASIELYALIMKSYRDHPQRFLQCLSDCEWNEERLYQELHNLWQLSHVGDLRLDRHQLGRAKMMLRYQQPQVGREILRASCWSEMCRAWDEF